MKKWIVIGEDGRYRAAKTVEALQGEVVVVGDHVQFNAMWNGKMTVWLGLRRADLPLEIECLLRHVRGDGLMSEAAIPVLDGRPMPSLVKPPGWSPYDDDTWWEGREPGRCGSQDE